MKNKLKLTFVRPNFEGMSEYCPPHMGIAVLYGYLVNKYKDFIDFSFIDALPNKLNEEQIIEKLNILRPEIICITVKTFQVEQTICIIEKIKKSLNTIIICGGNHVSIEPDLFINNGADFSIIGSGEIALGNLITIIINKLFNLNLKLYFSNNILANKNSCYYNDVYNLKFEKKFDSNFVGEKPNWDIMDIDLYNENIHINKDIKALPVMASRGCPYKCDFCSSFITWGTYVKYRDPEDVLDEIEYNINKYKIRDYHFYDDNLMLNRKWLINFLDKIKERNINFNWICLSRPEIIYKNRDLLLDMKKCNCKGFELGFETENDDLYNNMNKKNSKLAFKKAYDELCKYEFDMIEFLIMCFYEGETIDSLFETYKQLEKFKSQKSKFLSSRYFATPFLGTEFNRDIEKKGILISNSNKYKYAIFLNFMPYSFLNSNISNYNILVNRLKILYKLSNGFNNLIYKKEIENVINNYGIETISNIFNDISKKEGKFEDFIQELNIKLCLNMLICIELGGRFIEFAIKNNCVNLGGF